ncbi:MAG: RnfH family protein [Oleibacter sp.]|nr:RnfH family protein [Thalassolituus sp.]
MAEKITVEVAYALPNKQRILSLDILPSTSLLEAVKQSGIQREFPELNIDEAKFGIFGKAVRDPQNATLVEGDRIEIYRPLLIDPKQARANRAAKAAAK